MPRKLLLIHGYSDNGKSFNAWGSELQARGVDSTVINICNYITLNNEITIPDIAEGLARAINEVRWDDTQEFDAVVHSTGMLVIRAYLSNYPARAKYLKHLVGLAPATWGSPLASQGRSWLGAIVKGNHDFTGPDFLNAGDKVLDGLELGSKFTWDLAHRDLLCPQPTFTTGPDSPYVAVFIGNQAYPGIKELIDKPGTDGTVRWSGCSLDSRKITVDLRKPGIAATISPWAGGRLDVPMFAVEGRNHTTLLQQPDAGLADRIAAFLNVSDAAGYDTWWQATNAWNTAARAKMNFDSNGKASDGWQQFVIHVSDEYGDPVPDYVVDLFTKDPDDLTDGALKAIEMENFDMDVHPYQTDQSYRCFHVSLPVGTAANGPGSLWMRLSAASGTDLISYCGYGTGATEIDATRPIVLDISHLGSATDSLFHPYTTTLVEIRISRQPAAGAVLDMQPYPYQ